MVISLRDTRKLAGVALICACAAFVCFLFLTYSIELRDMAPDVPPGLAQIVYEGQLATSNVVVAIAGGALVATALVVLLFYVSQYVNAHSRELGVLKAMGWTTAEIARGFGVFGLSAAAGASVGCAFAIQQLPTFLDSMNEDGLLPTVNASIHPQLLVYLIVLPAVLFAAVSILYAVHRLQAPALSLMRGISSSVRHGKPLRDRDEPFLRSLRRSTLQTSKALTFFVFMGGFCFSCMLQMSGSMADLASEWMGVMMLLMGIVLALTCLVLSMTTAAQRCAPAAAIMRACGYTAAECRGSLLGCFRPFAYAGFAVGTVYQYVLLRLILDYFYADYPIELDLSFDVPLMILCLVLFALLYEGGLHLSSRHVSRSGLRNLAAD